jgi:hypothetical protein
MWYNKYVTNVAYYGAEFKLDVGLYQLDQQAACQRYRQNLIDANKVSSAWEALKANVASVFTPNYAFSAIAV